MSTLKHFTQRWWRPLLFVAWIWALTGLLKNQRYTAFLRPEFGVVIGLGVFTLLGFLVTGMAEARPRRFGIPQMLHTLILLLPLAHLWNAQGASLDAYAFRNRSLGLPTIEAAGDASASGNRTPSRAAAEPRAPEPRGAHETAAPSPSGQRTTENEQAEPERIAESDPSPAQRAPGPHPARQAENGADPSAVPPDPDDLAATDAPPETRTAAPGGKPSTLPDPGETTGKDAAAPRNPKRAPPSPAPRTPAEEKKREPAEADPPPTANKTATATAKAITITDLYYAPRAYEGKRVKLIGMLHKKDARVKKNFGKSLLVVFRFVITCCAADATPAAVLVDGKGLPDLPESSWVEVEGTFGLQEKNGRRVPVLEESSIKKTVAPKQPYLF